MATRLKAKSPTLNKRRRPKILVYGRAKVGKTWGAMEFPDNYYIDTEGGAKEEEYIAKLVASGAGYMGPEDGSCDLHEIGSQLRALATEKHQYKTVVIDSISKPWNRALGDEQERLGSSDVYGASKKKPIAEMRRIINWIDRVDMNVILIAHSRDEYGMVGNKREMIGTTFDAYDKLEYELELALQIEKINTNSRSMRVRASRIASFPEGETFEWSYAKFSQLYGREPIEGDAIAITLAAPAQVAEIRRLVDLMKISEEDQGKALAKRNADSYEELSESDAEDVITSLNEKINGKTNGKGTA